MSVRIDRVSKTFGTVLALDGVSLTVGRGELCVLVGPTGSGKTTLLRCAAGLDDVSGGSVLHDTGDGPKPPSPGRSCTMVFQEHDLFPHLDVLENASYGLLAQRFSRSGLGGRLAALWRHARGPVGDEIRARVEPILALLRLSEHASRMPSELSGGQRQRLSVARALALGPRVLLLDEPLSGQDRRLRVDLRERLRSYLKQQGITTLYVTHDPEEALAIADTVALLDRGRLVEVGAPAAVYAAPRSTFSAEFLGSGNLFEGTVQPQNGRMGVVACGDLHLQTSDPGLAAGERVVVLVRPEAVVLARAPDGRAPGGAAVNEFVGTVRRSVCLGPVVNVTISVGARELLATLLRQAGEVLAEGDRVTASVSAGDVRVVGGR